MLSTLANWCSIMVQTAHDHLSEWKTTYRDIYMPVYLEQAGRRNTECPACNHQVPATIRCIDCFGYHSLCRECILGVHQTLPCHRLEKWNGDCFTPTTLIDEGYLLHLGHGGLACPNAGQDPTGDNFDSGLQQEFQCSQKVTLVAVNGFFKHNVAWCGCLVEGRRVPSPMQLFREKLFPATQTRPETAFEFGLLDHFWVDMMECKTANQSFIRKLGRITNPDFPEDSPVGPPS